MFNEVKETPRLQDSTEVSPYKAFETEKTAIEKNSIEKIATRCENLAGKPHPDTGVMYVKNPIVYDGKLYEVFPKFESKFDTRLPKELYQCSDAKQFSYCTKELAKAIEKKPDLAEQFTDRQLEYIKEGRPYISGLTWHHNEVPGKMQLISSDIHSRTPHTGGRSVWGGGPTCR